MQHVHGGDRPRWNFDGLQSVDDLLHGQQAGPLFDQCVERVDVGASLRDGGEAQVGRERGIDQAGERAPLRVAGRADHHPAIGCTIRVPRGADRMPTAGAIAGRLARKHQRRLCAQLVCHHFQQAEVDALRRAAKAVVAPCGERGGGGDQAAEHLAQRRTDRQGCAAIFASDGHHAGARLQAEFAQFASRVRAGQAAGRQRAHHAHGRLFTQQPVEHGALACPRAGIADHDGSCVGIGRDTLALGQQGLHERIDPR